jgi:anti-sigma factor RsiW
VSSCAPHLGDIAAALADGEVSHDERDRAFVHMAWCPECRAAVDAERRAKASLAAAPPVRCDDDFLLRLAAIPVMSTAESFALVRSPMATPAPPQLGGRRFHHVSVTRRRLSAAVVGGASVLAFGVWAAPSGARSNDLVTSGAHPAYETTDAQLTTTRLRPTLVGYGFSRP